ncbi:hypothetical protein SprV_0501901500 [Sparganum proliferum]
MHSKVTEQNDERGKIATAMRTDLDGAHIDGGGTVIVRVAVDRALGVSSLAVVVVVLAVVVVETSNKELAQRLANLAAACGEDASVKNRWGQLRDTIQLTSLAVLVRARRRHQDWFDGNDAAIGNLLAKIRPHRAYLDRPTDTNKAVFY